MAKIPKDPKEIFEEIIDDYKGLFGGDLISIILYGSATGKDYRPGKSDINFMIVLSEDGIEHLDKAFKTAAKWLKRKGFHFPICTTQTKPSHVPTTPPARRISLASMPRASCNIADASMPRVEILPRAMRRASFMRR